LFGSKEEELPHRLHLYIAGCCTRAASYENIMHGFYMTGYLDRETRRYPVLQRIFLTLVEGDFLGMIMIK
jgi:hypothetical protein